MGTERKGSLAYAKIDRAPRSTEFRPNQPALIDSKYSSESAICENIPAIMRGHSAARC